MSGPAGAHLVDSRRAPMLLERGIAWSIVVFLSTLPLEWVTLRGIAGGFLKPFHLAAVAVIALCFARWRPGQLVRSVLRRYGTIYVAYFLLLALTLAGGLARTLPYASRDNSLRQAFYAGTSLLLVGILVHLAEHARARRILAWSGLGALLVGGGGFAVALSAQHVNPVQLLKEALAKGDPDIISYQLLRLAFRSEEDLATAGANLRHKVFLGLLVAVFVGIALLPAVSRLRHVRRQLLVVSGAVGCVFVVLSLSRSAIVCLLGPALFGAIRIFVRNRARPAQAALIGLLLLVGVGVLVSPVGDLVLNRFSTTESYEARVEGVSSRFLDQAEGAALIGGEKIVQGSPHNLLFDAWLSAGVVGATCALVMLVSYVSVWLRELRRYVTNGQGWVLPVHQVWLLGVGWIPLVRAVTAGNQFHMVEWTAIAVFLGVVWANQRAAPRDGGGDRRTAGLPAGLASSN